MNPFTGSTRRQPQIFASLGTSTRPLALRLRLEWIRQRSQVASRCGAVAAMMRSKGKASPSIQSITRVSATTAGSEAYSDIRARLHGGPPEVRASRHLRHRSRWPSRAARLHIAAWGHAERPAPNGQKSPCQVSARRAPKVDARRRGAAAGSAARSASRGEAACRSGSAIGLAAPSCRRSRRPPPAP